MQHTPLWRSKFRILRIKKTRTKIGTLRISHTSSKLHRDTRSRTFDNKDQLEENHELLLTRFGHWVEHTSIAQRFQRFCFCLYLYLPKLLSLNLYTWSCYHLLCFSSISFAHSASTLYIDVSISEFHEKILRKFTARMMFLAMCTILWRCKLKPPHRESKK